MKKTLLALIVIILIDCLFVTSCKKEEPSSPDTGNDARLTMESQDCSFSHCLSVWKDTQTGRVYLVSNKGGILEITPKTETQP